MGRTGPVRRADSRVVERPPERRRRRPEPVEPDAAPPDHLVQVLVDVRPLPQHASPELVDERVKAAITGQWVRVLGQYAQLHVVEQGEDQTVDRPRPGTRLTARERHRIVTAHRRGVPVTEIAMLTGRSHDAVERAVAAAATIPCGSDELTEAAPLE